MEECVKNIIIEIKIQETLKFQGHTQKIALDGITDPHLIKGF